MSARESLCENVRPPSFGHRRYVVASRAVPWAAVAFGNPTSLAQAQEEAAAYAKDRSGEFKVGVFELRLVKL